MEYTREQELKDLELDMKDEYKLWQDAEAEIKQAVDWRDKMALNYAKSAIKYFNFKNQ